MGNLLDLIVGQKQILALANPFKNQFFYRIGPKNDSIQNQIPNIYLRKYSFNIVQNIQ